MTESANTLKKSGAYVWFDAEFTSLDLERARLLQVAVIVTDINLQRIAPAEEDLNLSIRLGADVSVSPWVAEHLAAQVAKCRSNDAVAVEDADLRLAALLDRTCGTPCKEMDQRPVLAGNSVHNDWFLMRTYLPQFASRLHYRLLDVSAIKIQWQDWAMQPPFDKGNADLINRYYPETDNITIAEHDALFDIKASIAELAFYRSELMFRA